jgi:hypothetical protein
MSYSPHAFGITKGESAGSKFYLADANGDIEFQNSDKIIFGDGAEASIYWDGSALLIANQASQPVTLGHADATVTIPGNLTVTGTTTTVNKIEIATANGVVFEGAVNDYETTLVAADTTVSDKTWTLPDVTDTVVGLAATQTLTNKTLTSPVLTTPQINDTSANHQYVFAVSELAADRTVTLPLLGGADEFTFNDHAQTLTNKTLTSPDINGGTIDGATIATSDVTVGSTKTLNVSAGTLTTSAAQNLAIVQGAAANVDIGTFSLTANTLVSDVAIGTSPLTVTSTTKVANLNADLLDGMTTIDEGDMVSDSATALPTQQSVKAYVDAQSGTAAIDGTANGLNDRIATYSSATALNGEANLTFDGSDLTIASHDAAANGLILGSTLVTASAAELNILDGVTASAGQINSTLSTVTSATAISATSNRYLLVDTVAGAVTVTLNEDVANGTIVTIKKKTNDVNAVTITSTDNIDGGAGNVVLNYHNEAMTFISDSADWYVV